MARDVLEEILTAALREKALAPETIGDFAAGLRDRARIVLDERLRPVQERVATLEKENAWRASAIQSLTDENAAVADENRRVKDENQRIKDQMDPLLDENRRLKDENQRVKDENERVREEHTHLLEERAQLQDESRRVQDECGRLKQEMEGVRQEWRTASQAHDRLLEHHRAVTAASAGALDAVKALPIWRHAEVRPRLAELSAALRRDTV